MLFELPELNRKVWISAFHGSADPARLSKLQNEFSDATIQLFDLNRIAGSRHLLLATFNAIMSFDSKRRISRGLAMEILLFVSGTRQISEAVKRVGISSETAQTAALTVLPVNVDHSKVVEYLTGIFEGSNDDSLLDKWTSMRKSAVIRIFGIGDNELKAATRDGERVEKTIERLAIERSAMLAIAK